MNRGGRRPNPVEMCWHSDEDDRLRQLAGTMPLPDLVNLLNDEFAHLRPVRTLGGVTLRANRKLGVLVEYVEGFTMQQIARIVGWENAYGESRRGSYGPLIYRHWIAPGLLRGAKIRGRGRDGRWQIMEAEFERFLDEHPYAYDWRRFAPGPWRSRAEVIARRSPWRTVDDLRIYLGLQHLNFWESRWRDIPHKRRHHVLGGMPNGLGQALVDVALFPEIRALIAPELHRYTRIGGPKLNRAPRNWRRTCRSCRSVTIGRPHEAVPPRCPCCGRSIRRYGDPRLVTAIATLSDEAVA